MEETELDGKELEPVFSKTQEKPGEESRG